MEQKDVTRRDFIATTGTAVAGAALMADRVTAQVDGFQKKRLAIVGTGSRGSGMWGRSVLREYADYVEYVGLCDDLPPSMCPHPELGCGF
jgi:hypothetical protein